MGYLLYTFNVEGWLKHLFDFFNYKKERQMKLSEKQQIFTENIAKLIVYSYNYGIKLTFGHAWRSQEEQKRLVSAGKSKTMNSKHLNRLAVDFNFFVNGKLTYKREEIQPLGDYWESLHPSNNWGGNWASFVDTPHFEMS